MDKQIAALTILICCIVVMAASSSIANDRERINLSQDRGYTDILIAIDEKVPENLDIIEKLRVYLNEASKILYRATKNRLYIKNVTIVVPSGWMDQQHWLQPAENETFERARILIAQKNLAYGDTPYTLQPRGCGEEGDYIHITPNFLTTSESRQHPYRPAKKLVREFAKLRWGAFDEDISIADRELPQLYWHNGDRQLVGCTEGASFAPVNATGCQWSDGKEESDCDFVATKFHGTASLLSYEYFDNVVEFCDSMKDGDTLHNKLARNLQNKNCNEKSVWDVMLAHPDFAPSYIPPDQNPMPPQPFVRVVKKPYIELNVPPTTSAQASSSSSSTNAMTSMSSTTTNATTTATTPVETCSQDIVCLCLDVSGSMGTANRIGTIADSASVYILTSLREGTAVGIVSFSNNAYLHADMKKITSSADRSDLISALPHSAGGGTNIEAGLNECQRILRNYTGMRLAESRILLIGDGIGTVGSVIPSIKADGITIDTVLYGQGAAELAGIARETGGTKNFVSDDTSKEELRLFFTEYAFRGCSSEQTDTIVQNENIVIPAGEGFLESVVYLDETIGLDTKIVVSYNSDVVLIIETDKNLTTTITKDQSLQLIVAMLKGEMGGYIKYTIIKAVRIGSDQEVLVTVTSAPLPGVKPVVVSYKASENYVEFDTDTQFIGYVGVFQGYSPVLNLSVHILMDQPIGPVLSVKYVDDGSGKDSIPNDGIYTGFVPAHMIDGTGGSYFRVDVNITGEGLLPAPVEKAKSRGRRSTGYSSLGKFSRISSGSVIAVNNWESVPDITPPDRITDLTIHKVSNSKDDVTLTWTAPGEDLNIGQASRYQFGVAETEETQDIKLVPQDSIITCASKLQAEAGKRLELQIKTSSIPLEPLGLNTSTDILTFYFRVKPYDSSNNSAEWSNPVTVSYYEPTTKKSHRSMALMAGTVVGSAVVLAFAIGLAKIIHEYKSKFQNISRGNSYISVTVDSLFSENVIEELDYSDTSSAIELTVYSPTYSHIDENEYAQPDY